jgi:predicted lactoylglutathione lyase
MAQQIYVNLAVKDVARTKAFFGQLGFTFDPKFSNDKALAMIIGENIYVMLLAENFFKTFTKKTLCDATQSTEVLVCLSCDSRAQVDDLVARAQAAGGTVPRPPQDYGFMYGHVFEDLDGHIWELVYMDPNAEMPETK